MKVYKAIWDGGSLCARGLAHVTYIVGTPASAPMWLAKRGYHLCAFTDLARAKRHAWFYLGELWEAEGIDPLEELPQFCYDWYLTDGCLVGSTCEWYESTVMCKQIVLQRRLA